MEAHGVEEMHELDEIGVDAVTAHAGARNLSWGGWHIALPCRCPVIGCGNEFVNIMDENQLCTGERIYT